MTDFHIVTNLCAHLLAFVLGQVRLQLEVGFKFAGTELALVGAVNHNYLFGVSLALLTLDGLHLDRRVLITYRILLAALCISPCCTVLTLRWNICSAHNSVKNGITTPECLTLTGYCYLRERAPLLFVFECSAAASPPPLRPAVAVSSLLSPHWGTSAQLSL